jgi:peptidase M1-like protein
MENTGLITVRSEGMLTKPDQVTPSHLRQAAHVLLHEMAHQWFGGLVTMAWWDDLWLKEAFAEWLASRIEDEWHPDWERALFDVAAGRPVAMGDDGLAATPPVRAPVAGPHLRGDGGRGAGAAAPAGDGLPRLGDPQRRRARLLPRLAPAEALGLAPGRDRSPHPGGARRPPRRPVRAGDLRRRPGGGRARAGGPGGEVRRPVPDPPGGGLRRNPPRDRAAGRAAPEAGPDGAGGCSVRRRRRWG